MMKTNPLLGGLNAVQREAVTLPDTSALILAGAGSGKTRVLTTRLAWLLSEQRATPLSVLAVTFTNKAAREMVARLSVMTHYSTRGMWIGTFHGLCNRLLRTHYRDAKLNPQFQILDTADQLSLIKRLYRANDINEDNAPVKYKELQYFIQEAKERGDRPHHIIPNFSNERYKVELYQKYEAMCAHENVVDFAELMLRSVELLTANTGIREHYQHRFTHIFVDEFQDTNPLQYRWLQLLKGKASSVFAVGDDDQSIYAFRGANVAHMQSFERDFAVPDKPVSIIKLEQNYRSFGNILNAANALIKNNASRMGKNLWTDQGEGERINVHAAETEDEEARWIVNKIKAAQNAGVALSDNAILYRANAQSRALEHAAFTAGLPYRVYGGHRFFERAEIKNALAYLRLMASRDDEGALLRIINFPPRGIGARTVEQLQAIAQENRISLWQGIHHGALSGRAGANLSVFAQLIDSLCEETKHTVLPEMVEQVLARSGLIDHYQTEREGQDRLQNLNELIEAARRFVDDIEHENDLEDAEDNAEPMLTRFLARAALESGDTGEDEPKDAVQMMTMHAAKGLEFDTVFVTGLEEGLFPHDNSLNEAQGLEEERRLMYVALTRARRTLNLTLARTRRLNGQFRYNLPSRFLAEIPEELLHQGLPNFSTLAKRRETYDDHSDFGGDYEMAQYAPNETPQTETPKAPRAFAQRGVAKKSIGSSLGNRVRHEKFGEGMVINAEGSGNDMRVLVRFSRYGEKWLSLAYTTLTPI